MKKFVLIIAIAAVVGGFVGGELMGNNFSLTGAVIGGLGVFSVLMGLGALFHRQEQQEKARSLELTPEIRGVFDRMVGKESVHPSPPKKNKPNGNLDEKAFYLKTIYQLISVQLMPKYDSPRAAFGELMKNKRAAGYIFGFHDSFLQKIKLVDRENPKNGIELMKISYTRFFGEQAGYAIYSMSIASQAEAEFRKGQMEGGNDFLEFYEKKIPAFGLSLIINH